MKKTFTLLVLLIILLPLFAVNELSGYGTGETASAAGEAARQDLLRQLNVSFMTFSSSYEQLKDGIVSSELTDNTVMYSNVRLDIVPTSVKQLPDGSFSATCTLSLTEIPALLNQLDRRLAEIKSYEELYLEMLKEDTNLSSLNRRITNTKLEIEILEEVNTIRTILNYFNYATEKPGVLVSVLRNREESDLDILDRYLNSYKSVTDLSSEKMKEIQLAQQLYEQERLLLDEANRTSREAIRKSLEQSMMTQLEELRLSATQISTDSGSVEDLFLEAENLKKKLFEFNVMKETQIMAYMDTLEKDYLFDSSLIEKRPYLSSELMEDGSVSDTAKRKRIEELWILSENYHAGKTEILSMVNTQMDEAEKEIEDSVWAAMDRIIGFGMADNVTWPSNLFYRYKSYNPDNRVWSIDVVFRLFSIEYSFPISIPFKLLFSEDWKEPDSMSIEEYGSYNAKVSMMSEYLKSEEILPLVVKLEVRITPLEESAYRIEFGKLSFELPTETGTTRIGSTRLDVIESFHFTERYPFSDSDALDDYCRKARESREDVRINPVNEVSSAEQEGKTVSEESIAIEKAGYSWKENIGVSCYVGMVMNCGRPSVSFGLSAEYRFRFFNAGFGLEYRPDKTEAILFGEASAVQTLSEKKQISEWVHLGIDLLHKNEFLIATGLSFRYENSSLNLGCELKKDADFNYCIGIGFSVGLCF